jgi:hypothetical protein
MPLILQLKVATPSSGTLALLISFTSSCKNYFFSYQSFLDSDDNSVALHFLLYLAPSYTGSLA